MQICNNSTNILYNTSHLQLKSAKSPDGKFDWFYGHRPNTRPGKDDGVVIVPVIHEKEGDSVLFLESRRPPIYAEGKAETGIELPAGLIGDVREGETTEEAVKAELLEETGLEADAIKILMDNCATSGGCTSETVTLAKADISNPNEVQEPVSDHGVIVKRHRVPVNEISSWLKAQQNAGKSVSSHTLAAIYSAQAYGGLN